MTAPARLTEGPITPALVRLAWPVLVSRTLHTAYGVVGTFWVGRIGPEAIAAVSTSTFALWTLFALGDVLVAGVGAVAAQHVGARRDRDAAASVRAGFAIALAMGLAVAAIGWWGSPRLFSALLEDPEVARLGGEYLSLVALLAPLFYVGFVVDAAYRSCGDSRTPMLVLFVGTFLNVALDPLLILGLGPFPRLGVRGAAVATIVAQVSVVGIFAALAAAGRFPLRLRRDGAGPLVRREDLATVLRIGAPWALTGILFSVVYLFLSRVAGRFGAGALAALGIVNRMESISYLTAGAIGMAVSSMVGQNVGARLPDRAAAAADRGAWIVTATSGLVTVAFLAAPEPIVGAFTKDPVAIREAVSFLRIVAISQTVMCWEIVYNGAFIGVGMTMPPTLVSVTTSVARIPLAWWTAIVAGAGTAGLWWTITLTCIVRGIWTSWWFRRGTWRRAASRRHPLPPPDVLGPQTPEG